MKVRALKIAVIYGMAVGIGDELELNEKVAKAYIEKGFVEKIDEPQEVTEDLEQKELEQKELEQKELEQKELEQKELEQKEATPVKKR